MREHSTDSDSKPQALNFVVSCERYTVKLFDRNFYITSTAALIFILHQKRGIAAMDY